MKSNKPVGGRLQKCPSLLLNFWVDVSVSAANDAISSASFFLEGSVGSLVSEGERTVIVDFVVVSDGLDWRGLCLGFLGAWGKVLRLGSREWANCGDCWSVVAWTRSRRRLAVNVLVLFFVHVDQLLGVVLLGLWTVVLNDFIARLFLGAFELLNGGAGT